MDVICERCSTEYEFDETLLSARGTSVKCTNCGHVFKVYPAGADDADQAASAWRVKRPDGTIDAIESLRELQRQIAAGELTPDDEITRGEDGWKKLGSIPELETFFQAAGVQIRSPRTPSPLPPAPAGRKAVGTESSVPPGRRPRQPTLLGVSPVWREETSSGGMSAPAPLEEPARGPESVPGPELPPEPQPDPELDPEWESLPEPTSPAGRTSESPPAPEPELPPPTWEDLELGSEPPSAPESEPGLEGLRDSSMDIEDAEFEEPPRVPVRRSTPPPGYFDDDDDIPELPGRGWSPLGWLLLIAVVGGLALVAAQWERVARLAGIGSDPAVIAAGITEGDASLALGHPDAYENAIEAYGRAAEAGGDGDPELLAKLSNAHALTAQARLDEGASEEAVALHQTAALTRARSATALDPQSIDAKLAEADALRLAGELSGARAVLEEARAMSFSRTAEAFRVEARLTAAEAGGGLEHALQSAREAAELSSNGTRFVLLMARAERAAGNDARAKEALESILAEQPGHPVAAKLLGEWETETAAVAESAADAGTAAEPAAESAAGTATGSATEPATEPATASATASAKETATASAKETAKETEAAPVERASAARGEGPAEGGGSNDARRRPATERKPRYDEYDQLSKAAESDAFVDGRPPVRDYEWHMSRGWDELAAGNYARARAFFDSALEVKPGSAEAMDALGRVSVGTEDYASALRYFRVAAQRGHPDGYFELGRTYERLGREDEAVSAYYTYIKRNPTGTHAATARTAIKRLEPRAKLPDEPEPDQSPAPTQPTEESGQALP